MKFKLIRRVTTKECFWLDHDIEEGTIVGEAVDLYGCCTEGGVACYIPGVEGYCELPEDALVECEEKTLLN